MDTPRIVLLVFLLLFLFASPDTQRPSASQQRELEYLLAAERHALNLLNSTNYGDLDATQDRWINVTGLRQDDNYAWDLLPSVQERAREQQRDILNGASLLPDGRTSSPTFTAKDGRVRLAEHNGTEASISPWGGVYENITGIIRGHWVRSKVAENHASPIVNLTSFAPQVTYSTQQFKRNITGREGNLRIKLEEKESNLSPDNGLVRELRAEMVIKDENSSGDGWEMTLHGIHYPEQGGILLATTGQRFAGIFALPHFVLTSNEFALAQQYLNQTLHDHLVEQENLLTSASLLNPWSSSPNSPSESMYLAPQCEFIVYLQQHPIPSTKAELEGVEKELRFPTGAPLPTISAMKMSALIFSPDCGFVLESRGPPDFAPQQGTHLVGQKIEAYIRLAKRGILAFGVLICAEIYLLLRQMNDTSTPSTRSRVSFYAIALMGLGDGFSSVGLMLTSFFVDDAFLPLISTAFIAFLGVSFFGMKFLMDIWTVQGPERSERARRDAAANPAPAPTPRIFIPATITAAGADTLPLPVTASRPADSGATPYIIPSDQDLGAAEVEGDDATQPATQTRIGSARREMGAVYSRFYFLLLSVAFLSLHATSWPTTIRSVYANMLAFTYLSFWAPQIYRNVIRNCHKALRWEFVIGQSILRLIPFAYFYIVEDNILFVETDQNAAWVLVGWVWIQVWALASQEILGPRFFIPTGWAPPAYDYHPILREDDQEAGAIMPIGFTQGTTRRSHDDVDGEPNLPGKRTFDCAICMQSLEVPVVPAGGGGRDNSASLGTTLFSRRAYMVTPCRHIFHSPCLEGWMKYRLQCPICRDDLPPL